MRFGMTAEEAKEDARFNRSSGGFIKYLKDGNTTFRILQEPNEWIHYAEHFNPGGFAFPCNGEPDCPGCTSNVEKMKGTSPQVAFNVQEGEYTNVYKIPRRLADKFMLRFDRLNTLTDRDYTITKYKNSSNKTDYEVEGESPKPFDFKSVELRDIESLLQQAWDDSWGDSEKVAATKRKAQEGEQAQQVKQQVEKREAEQDERPPSEPKAEQNTQAAGAGEDEFDEEDLRKMDLIDLVRLCDKQGVTLPNGLKSSDEVVDWLKANQS